MWNADDFRQSCGPSGNVSVLFFEPTIFLRALTCGFLSMEHDIKQLIFDEAHHMSGDDKYRLIMDLFYFRCPANKRPLILGLSASPTKSSKLDAHSIPRIFRQIEQQYESRIFYPPSASLEGYCYPIESVMFPYDPVTVHRIDMLPPGILDPQGRPSSPQYSALISSQQWSKCQRLLQSITEELGVDEGIHFIKTELESIDIDKLETLNFDEATILLMKAKVEVLQKQLEFFQSMRCEPGESNVEKSSIRSSDDLSKPRLLLPTQTPKLLGLVVCLHKHLQLHGQFFKAIVFCQQRIICIRLTKLLQEKGFKCECVVGLNSTSISKQRFNNSLEQFRSNDPENPMFVNILLATSVVEEGIDVPSCRLVIRFSEVRTLKQNVQSAGRARHRHSQIVHMIPRKQRQVHERFVGGLIEFQKQLEATATDTDRPKPQLLKPVKSLKKDFKHHLYIAKTGAFLTPALSKQVHSDKNPSQNLTGSDC